MAISLKSNLVKYYEDFGTNTGPPPALDKKGDYTGTKGKVYYKMDCVIEYNKED